MSVKSFWIILLKILGIWFILDSLKVLEQLISSFYFLINPIYENDEVVYISFGILLILIVLFFITLRLFLFKPKWLIQKLKLDKDFDQENIDVKLDKNSVIRIACIFVGSFLFIESFPQLISRVFQFFQQENLFRESPTSVWIILEAVKCIIAFLLVNNNKLISEFVDRRSK